MICFRLKLLGFLLFFSVYGNTQEPIVWHVDRDSAFVHFPLRDSLLNEFEFLLKQQELKLKELDEELDALFPPSSCFGPQPTYDDRDTLAFGKNTREIQAYELETNRLFVEKSKEFGELIVSSFEAQFEAFCKLHPEKTIVFEPMDTYSSDWFDLTAKFILFLEENNRNK
jgi:hypothetical protein